MENFFCFGWFTQNLVYIPAHFSAL